MKYKYPIKVNHFVAASSLTSFAIPALTRKTPNFPSTAVEVEGAGYATYKSTIYLKIRSSTISDNLVDGHLVWISKPAQNAHLPGCPVTGIRRTIFLVIKHSSFNGAGGTSRGPIQADGRQNSSSSGKETPGGNSFIN